MQKFETLVSQCAQDQSQEGGGSVGEGSQEGGAGYQEVI